MHICARYSLCSTVSTQNCVDGQRVPLAACPPVRGGGHGQASCPWHSRSSSAHPFKMDTVVACAMRTTQNLSSARGRQAGECYLATPFADVVAVKPVGEIRERDACGRVGPRCLAAKTGMSEGIRRIGASKAAHVGLAIPSGHGNP